jgi:hypothetical protein
MTKKRIYSMILGEGQGDFIYCTNCGETSLVKCGINNCPMCATRDCNMWVNEDKQEYTINEVETIANTVIIPLPKERIILIEAMDLASQTIGE